MTTKFIIGGDQVELDNRDLLTTEVTTPQYADVTFEVDVRLALDIVDNAIANSLDPSREERSFVTAIRILRQYLDTEEK